MSGRRRSVFCIYEGLRVEIVKLIEKQNVGLSIGSWRALYEKPWGLLLSLGLEEIQGFTSYKPYKIDWPQKTWKRLEMKAIPRFTSMNLEKQ